MKAATSIILLAFVAAVAPTSLAQPLDSSIRQLIVCITPRWDSPHASLRCFEKGDGGWSSASRSLPALVGRNGLAWGRGILPGKQSSRQKTEGDRCSPAGIFAVGRIFGYAPFMPPRADFPYRQVSAADAWIDDPRHPQYNQHVVIDPLHPPEWFEQQRMRLGDPAYRWLIEIRHNATPVVAGAGSAIFMHIRRGKNRPTAGCTALAEDDIEWIVRWLREEKKPHVVALPREEYQRLWSAWGLPAPESTGAFSD
ncbi:MAG TPA: L,D-transpeptidase family protein [Opitutaceae bacterium]